MEARVTRLYPQPPVSLPLAGLYLAHHLRERGESQRPYIYSNFIASLDGRIAWPDPRKQRRVPPRPVTHPHDWRLYLELAAQADAVLVSGRRLRELYHSASGPIRFVPDLLRGELAEWRRKRALPPQPDCLVLSRALDFDAQNLAPRLDSRVTVVTGGAASRARLRTLTRAGVDVVTASTPDASGQDVHRIARERGYRTLYSIAGPEVLHTLLASSRIDRLYLTHTLRLIGGRDYDTLTRGDKLTPPRDWQLHELHHESFARDPPDLLYASFERAQSGPV